MTHGVKCVILRLLRLYQEWGVMMPLTQKLMGFSCPAHLFLAVFFKPFHE